MRFLPFLCALTAVAPAIATADVFRWVDENGVAHYTFDESFVATSADVAAPPPARAKPSTSARELRGQLALTHLPGPRALPAARRIPPPRPSSARPYLRERVRLTPEPGRSDVQLAALRSADQAWYEWVRLADDHDDLLGGLQPYVVPVDLGPRGRFFRLRAGPVADAVTFCNRLSVRRIACLAELPD